MHLLFCCIALNVLYLLFDNRMHAFAVLLHCTGRNVFSLYNPDACLAFTAINANLLAVKDWPLLQGCDGQATVVHSSMISPVHTNWACLTALTNQPRAQAAAMRQVAASHSCSALAACLPPEPVTNFQVGVSTSFSSTWCTVGRPGSQPGHPCMGPHM